MHETFGHLDLVAFLDQGLAALGLLDLFGAVEKLFERAEFVDQKRGGLDADAGRAGDVVDAITGQCLHIDDAIRADAEFLDHAVAVDAFVLHRIEHFDAAADKLHQVFVRGNDGASPSGLAGLGRQSGDDVVGLEAFNLFAGDVERLGCSARQGELRHEVFGRWRSVCLVEVVEIIAEAFAGVVKDHGGMGGGVGAGVAFDIAVQHVAEPGHGPDGQPVGFARQGRQGMIGAEDERRAVDQVQMAALAESGFHVARSLVICGGLRCAMSGRGVPDGNRASQGRGSAGKGQMVAVREKAVHAGACAR